MVDESDLVTGVVKGGLEFTKDQLVELAKTIKDGKAAFIQDPETVKDFHNVKQSPEWALLSPHIKNKDLVVLLRLGILLRYSEHDQDMTNKLRQDIRKRYGLKGLHIAQAVQNGIIHKLIFNHGPPLDGSKVDMTSRIEELLEDVDHYVDFISPSDKAEVKARIALNRIDAHMPSAFVLCGAFHGAEKVNEIVDELEGQLDDYEIERNISSFKTIVYLIRKR